MITPLPASLTLLTIGKLIIIGDICRRILRGSTIAIEGRRRRLLIARRWFWKKLRRELYRLRYRNETRRAHGGPPCPISRYTSTSGFMVPARQIQWLVAQFRRDLHRHSTAHSSTHHHRRDAMNSASPHHPHLSHLAFYARNIETS